MKISKIVLILSLILIVEASKKAKRGEKEKSSCHHHKNVSKVAKFALLLGAITLGLQKVHLFGNAIPEINSRKFEYENVKTEIVPDSNEHFVTFNDNYFKAFEGFKLLKEESIKSKMNHDISRKIMAGRLTELSDTPIESLSKNQMMEYCKEITLKFIESNSIWFDPVKFIRYRIDFEDARKFFRYSDSEMERSRKSHETITLWGNSYYISESFYYQYTRAFRDCSMIFDSLDLKFCDEMNKIIDEIEKSLYSSLSKRFMNRE